MSRVVLRWEGVAGFPAGRRAIDVRRADHCTKPFAETLQHPATVRLRVRVSGSSSAIAAEEPFPPRHHLEPALRDTGHAAPRGRAQLQSPTVVRRVPPNID